MRRTTASRNTPGNRLGESAYDDGQALHGYAIGYRRPPVESRFKPGMSGNPTGRRKGSKNLKTLIRQAMTAKITIQEGLNSRRVTKIEGVVLRQLQRALKGNDRAAMAVVKMAMQMGFLEDTQANAADSIPLTPTDKAILDRLLTPHRTRWRSKGAR